MISKDFFAALDLLEREKNIKKEYFLEALEAAFTSGLKKQIGEGKLARVILNPDRNTIRFFSYKTVVEDKRAECLEDTEIERAFDPDKEIILSDAVKIKKSFKIGDTVETEEFPKDFKRVAATVIKQVVMQKIKEAEKNLTMDELGSHEGEIITATVRREDERNIVYLETGLGAVEGVMMQNDQIPGERYNPGKKVKVFVRRIKDDFRGMQIQVSRSSGDFVRKLFELEVPEIAAGIVVIKNVSREAGERTKIAVYSQDPSLDPIGACVGSKGARVNSIVSELNGEKIDIVPFSDNPVEFIAASISPARAISIDIDEVNKASRVVVPADKLSLAIGRRGINVRLAAKLTGWKIDVIKAEGEIAKPVSENNNMGVEISDSGDNDDIFSDL